MSHFDDFLKNYTCWDPILTMDDILFFLNSYYEKKFHILTKALFSSQIATYPRNILIDFGQWNYIWNEVWIKKIQNLFKLCAHGLVFIIIKDIDIGKEIKTILDKQFIIKRTDSWGFHFFQKKYEYSLWERIFWPKIYTLDKGKYYINDFLDIHLEELLKNITLWTDFNMQVYDTTSFTTETLSFIEKLQDSKKKAKQGMNLYEELRARLWDSINYGWEIILSYPIQDYAENKWFYESFIYKLHVKEKLNIKEIFIEKMYVTFIIERLVNFDKDDFIIDESKKTAKAEKERSSFDPIKWILKILGKEFNITKRKKIFDILNLIYSIHESTGNMNISLEQIWEEYRNNRAKYHKLSSRDLNYDWIRDILKNRLKDIWRELERTDKIIGIDTGWITIHL